MKDIALVFVGGGVGSALRFLLGRYISRYSIAFPWATLTVNIIASFALGFIMAIYLKKPDTNYWLPLLLGVGFCGGLSTFSTFSYEGFMMLQKNEVAQFLVYTGVSLVACLAAVATGYYAAK